MYVQVYADLWTTLTEAYNHRLKEMKIETETERIVRTLGF